MSTHMNNLLAVELQQFEQEYNRAKSGLKIGLVTGAITILVLVIGSLLSTSTIHILSNTMIIATLYFIAIGAVFYFSYVYQQITDIKEDLDTLKEKLDDHDSAPEN
ncbi:hypothetical protein ACFSJY_04445 [Thalassotalea euphylliae]|uniref:hypothetical protein n=1 Tax=Thalassotalea euphylliae TaxID=1655234 RepID=UPI00362C45DC